MAPGRLGYKIYLVDYLCNLHQPLKIESGSPQVLSAPPAKLFERNLIAKAKTKKQKTQLRRSWKAAAASSFAVLECASASFKMKALC